MTNTTIAKTRLKKMKRRTQVDLYHLRYEDMPYYPLNEDVLNMVREISKRENFNCPIYKWGGKVRLKDDIVNYYNVLNYLASNYGIVFNLRDIIY